MTIAPSAIPTYVVTDRRTWLDVAAALALALVAIVLRRHFPTDGLFYDDAWQALGAIKGSLADLPLVGQSQPGFTLELMGWRSVAGTGATSMVIPTLIAGVLGPPLLYLFLRRCGFVRSVSVLLGALMAAAPLHIAYSTRVKSYTTDVVLMMLITLVVGRVARWRWQGPTAAAWVVGSILAATYSSFTLLGVVAAGIILVLHPNGDRRIRIVAVGVQLLAHAAYLLAVSQRLNSHLVAGFFVTRGGYIALDPNPVTMTQTVLDHLLRVVQVFPGLLGPRWFLLTSLLAAAGGLARAAWRGPLAIRARFLLLSAMIAIAGSVVHLVPFGPYATGTGAGRVTLWLIPALAVGLATTLDLLRRALADRRPLRIGLDAVALGLVVVVLVGAGDNGAPYPAGGARDATRYVMHRLEERDVVWITRPTSFSFALAASSPLQLEPTPERAIGFLPDFADPRFVPIPDYELDSRTLDASLADADRVWIVHAEVKRGPGPLEDLRRDLAARLDAAGFELRRSAEVGSTAVDLWLRSDVTPSGTPR